MASAEIADFCQPFINLISSWWDLEVKLPDDIIELIVLQPNTVLYLG